ncbi:disulfide bond formation protein DsbD [Algimonas arctica]|uniref:Disulfide bond formation protein DsbD n=1 Tax=Algimonas arctica TaxID=1479486 RepID=A0A8J3CNM3_9PROT|nr:thioredoxin domain-containing protein [Algimonas arctica]GHA82929.1 disulfide bond formation protein DsbD [Algimonas arctica]
MASLIRTTLLIGTAALFTACGNAAETTDGTATSTPTTASTADRTSYERPDDHAIGRVDAPLVIVEYASVTCPGCSYWHQTVYPEFKARYVDTGKVRFVFREFLTGNPQLAEAGFKIALCADPDNYFKNIKLQFDRLQQITQMAQAGNARTAYINLAKASGLSEEEFATCMANEAHRDHINSKMEQGFDEGVTGTPAFFINGKAAKIGSVEAMDEVLMGLLGETPSEVTDEETPTVESAE